MDTGTRRLLGKIDRHCDAGSIGWVYDAVELQCNLIQMPTAQGIAEVYSSSMRPVDAEDEPAKIRAVFANLRLLDEMPDKGKKYLDQRDSFLRAVMIARAQRAGILPATDMPKGGILGGSGRA